MNIDQFEMLEQKVKSWPKEYYNHRNYKHDPNSISFREVTRLS